MWEEKEKKSTTGTFSPVPQKGDFMMPPNSQRPVFGQPGWRRRMEAQYGWDKEFKAAGIILLLIFLSLAFAHADGDTGLPGDDPKDLGPVRPEVSTTSCVSEMFLPMPEWSRFEKMPPLPEVLTPMGHSLVHDEKPRPAALAETKPDAAPPPKLAPKPKVAQPDPDQVAISPFLQWIKDHPDAAAQARKQAVVDAGAPAAGSTAAAPAPADPYWMPPMIDSSASGSDVQAAGGVGGSAAIYSRPQR
jgi:hypothetical protein